MCYFDSVIEYGSSKRVDGRCVKKYTTFIVTSRARELSNVYVSI